MRTLEQVIADIADILREFPDRECLGEIHPSTRFFDDLGYASIDAIVLGEKIEQRYGQRFPFREFLRDLRGREELDIEVGELAAFVHRNLEPLTSPYNRASSSALGVNSAAHATGHHDTH